MGGAHVHRREQGDEFQVGPAAKWGLLGSIAVAMAATVVGLVLLWPDGERADEIRDSTSFTRPGVTFASAEVEGASAGSLRVRVAEGDQKGEVVEVDVPPEVAASDLGPGDRVRVIITPPTGEEQTRISYFGTERTGGLWVLGGLFVVVVLAVARVRGLLALLGLGFAGLVFGFFMLPALLVGEPGTLVGLVGSAAIMLVVLYTTHGFSLRTSAALAGTLAGLVATALLGVASIRATHLTGVSDESGGVLSTFAGQLDFQGLLACALVVAGLGVLNDVTITQASAVWELRAVAPTLSRAQLFARGMRIGRDHIASTIYTIAFAYAGAALTVLLVLQLYAPGLPELLATEEITQEVVRTLVSSTGLVLAVPLTTAIAVLTVPSRHRMAATAGGASAGRAARRGHTRSSRAT